MDVLLAFSVFLKLLRSILHHPLFFERDAIRSGKLPSGLLGASPVPRGWLGRSRWDCVASGRCRRGFGGRSGYRRLSSLLGGFVFAAAGAEAAIQGTGNEQVTGNLQHGKST